MNDQFNLNSNSDDDVNVKRRLDIIMFAFSVIFKLLDLTLKKRVMFYYTGCAIFNDGI